MSDKLQEGRQQGWFWLHNELWDNACEIIGPYATGIYLGLSRYADTGGCSFPHVRTLARKGKMSVRQVQASLNVLEKYNMVSRTLRPASNGGFSGNNYQVEGPDKWTIPTCVSDTPPAGGAGQYKETQVKEIPSSYEEGRPAESADKNGPATEPEKPAPKAPFNYVKVYIDTWRTAFPGEPGPDIPPRYMPALRKRGQEITGERFAAVVSAYCASDHYQAVQGGHNVKTFLDWPAETWTKGRAGRPPAARPSAQGTLEGTLDEQKEAMRQMREGKG